MFLKIFYNTLISIHNFAIVSVPKTDILGEGVSRHPSHKEGPTVIGEGCLLEKISLGVSIALLAGILPNAVSMTQPGLPVGLVHQAMEQQSTELAAAQKQLQAQNTPQLAVNGTLMLGHRLVYLHRVSAYNAVAWQTNSNPSMSACGPTRPNQIALSQDLFFRRNGGNRCGEKVDILLSSGQVVQGVVWDTMNARYKMSADILMGSVQQAVDFGVQRAELRFLPHTGAPKVIGS